MKFLIFLSLIFVGTIYSQPSGAQIKIGIFADCQYCDCEPAGSRYYQNSLSKLSDCVAEFNKNKKISFVVGLGDFIDRDFSNFSAVNSILKKSKNKVFQVIGNHDLSVDNEFINDVPKQLNLSKTYYSIHKKGWQFIFLNGNEITLQSTDPKIVERAEKMIDLLTSESKLNNQKWNGGISEVQLNWLEKELQKAEKNNRKVVLFCHYPLLPFEIHSLWNSEEVLSVLNQHDCVKAWINGHNHAGNYVLQNGIHFINLKGMVETENENAFSVVSFLENEIEIEGFGREVSRVLSIK